MNKAFWKNKRILITGFEGFLGSNLTKTLLSFGAAISGLDIITRRKDTLLAREDFKNMRVYRGSVADYALVNRILSRDRIEYVFHLAAEAIVGECNKNPLKAFSSNIEGTWKLLEACRKSNRIKAIIVASSDKAYGSHKVLPYKEDAALKGDHPYDASKSCADLIAYTYFHTYKLPVAVTRCGNIYGPGDYNYSRIVPDAMRCTATGKTLKIRSDGRFTRDYVYVDDIVNGYIMLAEQLNSKKLYGEAFNFSDENPVTVLRLIKIINELSGKTLKYRILNRAQYEIKDQFLDSKKARIILGWKPGISINNGLLKTLRWYMDINNLSGRNK